MSHLDNWWRTLAPYWEHLEDRHLGAALSDRLIELVEGPALVVGAGQGLVVEHLAANGLAVDGVDMDDEMVRLARERRGLDIVRADGAELPFEDGRYATVIVSTGVVDYLDDRGAAVAVLEEALRVLAPGGRLMVAFFRIKPEIAAIMRRIGVVDSEGYHLRRLFELNVRLREGAMKCVPMIAGWTGGGFLPTTLYWARLGLTLPRELKEENRAVERVFTRAAADGVSLERLLSSVPELLPLRGAAEIGGVLAAADLAVEREVGGDDCVVAVCRRREPGDGDAPSSPVIEARRLTKSYKGSASKAVDAVDLDVPRGSIYGLLGPNGAGKTTTLSMLLGLVKPDAGTIGFAGGGERRRIAELVGFAPQELAVFDRLSGADNLRFFGRLHGLKGSPLSERIATLLEMVGLAGRADDLVGAYSQGMKRRLNLAAGLVHDPDILLLDEPTVGIDPQSRNRIFEAIAGLKARGATIIYTTHYMEEASRLCDRLAIMDHGAVIAEGRPRGLIERHGRFRLEYRVEEGASALVREASGLRGVDDARVEDGLVAVMVEPGGDHGAVMERVEAAAAARGLEPRLRNVREPDLESVFLDLTGRTLRDGGEA